MPSLVFQSDGRFTNESYARQLVDWTDKADLDDVTFCFRFRLFMLRGQSSVIVTLSQEGKQKDNAWQFGICLQ